MKSVVGIFNSFTDAKRAVAMLRSLGLSENRISVLAPGTSEDTLEANLLTTETEQPGMGRAMGSAVGGAVGIASGATLGAAAATILVPGVGPVVAFGLIGAVLLGGGGATVGAVAGGALEEGITQGLPCDELYVYEDALRRGRSVVIAVVEEDAMAEQARTELARAGAESVDAAREEWWIGLRDAEEEHYVNAGGAFKIDEATYRLGFEAALHPDRRERSYDEAAAKVAEKYGAAAETPAFGQGYERGRRYRGYITEIYKA